jgi:N-acetylmuramoyl-L-alanine amidase CwlA
MKLVESIMTKNPCYTAGRKITVKGLMLHSVGCPQPSAQVFIKNWNSASYKNACVHGFIDANDGTVYQTLPWDHRGWHAGGSANNTHIGVEMCEPSCIKYTSGSNFTCSDTAKAQAAAKKTYEAAVELFAMLCKKYNLDPTKSGVIISHKEGHTLGVASGHADPDHLWTGLGMSYTMDGFRKDVKTKMGGVTTATTSTTAATTNTATSEYKVKVAISNLRIRKSPSTSGEIVGTCTPGIYTITAESTGTGATKWGKLKSGAGWISLDYATKV